MNPEIKKFIYDIISASEDIKDFIENIGFEEFKQSKLIQAAGLYWRIRRNRFFNNILFIDVGLFI